MNTESQAAAPSASCFVVFPFREPFLHYYESIYAPAIREVALEPVKGNDIFSAGDVLAQIWRSLKDSQLILAELSLLTANVYYEVGLAHALRKPSVLVTQSLELVPFDLQAGRCITYALSDPFWGERLKASIAKALKETLAEPHRSIPAAIRLDSDSSPIVSEHSDESNNDTISHSTIEARLGQLQQSVDHLLLRSGARTTLRAGGGVGGIASPDELGAVAKRLSESGLSAAEIVQHLIDLGASELWARRIADRYSEYV